MAAASGGAAAMQHLPMLVLVLVLVLVQALVLALVLVLVLELVLALVLALAATTSAPNLHHRLGLSSRCMLCSGADGMFMYARCKSVGPKPPLCRLVLPPSMFLGTQHMS